MAKSAISMAPRTSARTVRDRKAQRSRPGSPGEDQTRNFPSMRVPIPFVISIYEKWVTNPILTGTDGLRDVIWFTFLTVKVQRKESLSDVFLRFGTVAAVVSAPSGRCLGSIW